MTYDDPTTVPAGDIADNPYWKRDTRRNYPRLSVVGQADAVALLTMGNAANPDPKLLAGEEVAKQLVSVKAEGEKGLAAYFEGQKSVESVLGKDGMPPMPPAFGRDSNPKTYAVGEPSYNDRYVKIMFDCSR